MHDRIDLHQNKTEAFPAEPVRVPETDCFFYDVGRQHYPDTLRLQLDLHTACREGRIPGAVIAVEHEPVITLGVKMSPENLLAGDDELKRQGIEVVRTDRGGDVTYHGPGQLVIYPILNLRKVAGDIHTYLRLLEECVILTLGRFGLEGHRSSPAGVWVGERKICSMGVAVRGWVTYHGLALNVSPDMNHFAFINPCGLSPSQMVSLAELVQPCPGFDCVKSEVLHNLAQLFRLNLAPDLETGGAI